MNDRPATFTNLADPLLLAVWQGTEGTSKSFGHWGLLQRTKSINGYEKAKASYARAWLSFMHGKWFKKLPSLTEATVQSVEELFFNHFRHVPSEALKRNAQLITVKAQEGDVTFFRRLSGEMRGAARASKRERNPLAFDILAHWLASCLWLASDSVAATYLQQVTRRTVQETAYAKTRARLGLIGYEVEHKKPIISGLKKSGEFIFADGWTNLAPSPSSCRQ